MYAEVDLITNHRQPQPRLAAVYLLMPTSLNVDLILRDYAPSAQPEPTGKSSKKQVTSQVPQEPPKYAAAYVNFMEGEAFFSSPVAQKSGPETHLARSCRHQRCPRREIDGRPAGELLAGPEGTLHQLPRSVSFPFPAAGRFPTLLHMLMENRVRSSRAATFHDSLTPLLLHALRSAGRTARASSGEMGGRHWLDRPLRKSIHLLGRGSSLSDLSGVD